MTGRRAGGRLKQWAHLALLLAAAHCSPPPRSGAPVVASNHVRGPIAMPEERATVEVNAALLRSADPCQDFYRFACGGWLNKVAMPSDYSMWGRGMIEVREFQLRELRRLLSEDPADDPGLSSAEDFFRACSEAGDAATAAANLQPFVDLIASVNNAAALMHAVGVLHMIGVPVLFTITTGPDWMNPEMTLVSLDQGGLGLHVPSFYLGTDLVSHTVRDQYRAHVVRMLALVGESDAAADEQANTVMAFEHSLAEIFRARDPQLEPQRLYRKAAVTELQELTPHLPWEAYFTEIGHSGSGGFNVAAPEYLSELDRLIAASDFRVVRAYLRWQLVHYTAEMLADAVAAEHFRFYQSIVGSNDAEPRWRRCVQSTDQALGDSLARAYLNRHPVGESERGVHDMIGYVAPAVEAMVSEAAWMDANTRGAAAAKLRGVKLQVGHPTPWPDRDEAPESSGDYFAKSAAIRRTEFARALSRVGTPIDRSRWIAPALTVNAFYSAPLNQITIPAGIMRPPFFDPGFPAAVNFGGLGTIIAHEFSHAIDRAGRHFDGAGRLSDWWGQATVEQFVQPAQCLRRVYGSTPAVKLRPTLAPINVNGEVTLTENMADIAGVRAAYRAYKQWTVSHDDPPSRVTGLNNDQLFFVAFAQAWCTRAKPEAELALMMIDRHAPPHVRVNGSLSQSPDFAEAFGCEIGTRMHPTDVCSVW